MIYSFEKRGNGGLGSGLDTLIEEDPCIASWQWKLFLLDISCDQDSGKWKHAIHSMWRIIDYMLYI